MSKKMRFLSFFLALAMVISSAPIVPVYAQEEASVSGLTVPFRSDVPFTVNGTTVTSNSYRIPAMVTLSDGTIVAATDIRWNTTYDGGGLDTLVAKSADGGKTWSYTVANYLGDNGNTYDGKHSTAFLDPSLLVAADGQTVYMLVDLYPYGVALNGGKDSYNKDLHTQPSTAVGFNEDGYLLLSGDNHRSYSYYLKDGKIYTSTGTPVEGYKVDAFFNISGPDGIDTNLFCEDSPYKVVRTGYLYLTSSKDGGATWSEPTLLNVKTSSERVCLIAPGNSITTSSGTMIFPVYSYHGDNDPSGNTQRLSFIYSKDGINWSRSSEFNYNWASEAAVVELNNGSLRFFFRNGTKKLCYVDYHIENGWGDVVTLSGINANSNTQISAITYSQTSNGKQVVLVSCPTGPSRKGSNSSSASNRLNGSIFVFTVASNGDMNLENTIYVNEKDNQFIYSCMAERSDGSVLILFEDKENGWGTGDNCFYTMDIKGYLPSALGINLDKPTTVIVNSNGNTISDLAIDVYEKTTLKAKTYYFTGDVKYQWQIEHESGKWADIYGETGDSLHVTFGLIANLLGEDGKASVRCKTTTLLDTVYSQTVNISIAPYEYEEPEEEPEEESKVVVSESVTTSSGKTAVVNIAGEIPEDASIALNEIDPSDVEIAEGEAVALALDITIKNADGTEWQPESGKKVTVTVGAYQLGLTNGDKVAIYHVHNGEVSILGTFEVVDYLVTFEVDGFSEFIFTVDPDDDYQELIGLYAGFNALNQWTGEGSFDYFWLKNDPTDPEESNFVWSIYDNDFEIDQVVKVRNYYVDSARSLWIEVEGVNGLELPKSLQEHPWIHMNSLNVYDYTYNTLFFFEPEDLSGEDISLVDQYGLSVWELYIDANHKREITVKANLSGEVKYRWEVCYDTENLLWTEINGETSPSLNLSFGMLSGVLQDGEWALLRCVAYNATESVTSNVIIARVIVPEIMTLDGEPQQVIVVSTAPEAFAFGRLDTSVMMAKSVAPMAEGDKVYVNLVAQKEDGTVILREPYELEYSGTVHREVTLPYIKGFDLCDKDGNPIALDTVNNVYNYTVDKANVTENLDIVLTYKPGKTTYKVTYYLQNVLDDRYTKSGDSVVLEGITGEMVDVSDPAFSKAFEGFYQLLFETAEIASDGSTEIEVFYDRLYYKMLFNLAGGYGVQPVYARYGTPVTVDNPTKSGYVFSGWDRDNDGKVDIEQFIGIEVPAYHTTYTAIWRASDGAKVTVIVWGENANDDGYSYYPDDSFEINASTGSTITYAPGQLMCGFEEHTHNAGCGAKCGYAEEHTHSVAAGCYKLICGKDEHITHTDACWNCGGIQNHTISCYKTSDGTLRTSAETMADRLATLRSMSQPNVGELYRIGNRGSYRFYFKLGTDYYEVYSDYSAYGLTVDEDTRITLKNNSCHPNLHTKHDSSCRTTCKEHTHSDSCYQLNCSKPVHTHSAACFDCGKKAHAHDASCKHTTSKDNSNLWMLNPTKTGSITVTADGSTTLNVYYDRTAFTVRFKSNGGGTTFSTVTKKWGASIRTEFISASTTARSYMWSRNTNASNGPWTSFLAVMPQENRDYYAYVSSSNNTYKANYYGLKLGGTPGTKADYDVLFPIEFKYSGSLSVTEEEFETIEGFTLNESMSAKVGNSYNGSAFYYDRNSYQLVFMNYDTEERKELVYYEAPLSVYDSYSLDASKAPSIYQPGSVTFKGWYLAPQTPNDFNFNNVKPFDFTNSTMPADHLILYAWWEPVKHDVTFYHSYEDMLVDNVYTVGDTTYDYDVPHGSRITSPYTPPANPTNGKYSFNGWFYVNEKGIETLWSFEDSTVTSDVKIYAKWTSNTLMPYTVRFVYKDEDGKEIEIAAPITGSALAGNTKTFNAKVGSELKDGYQTKYFPEVHSHSLTIDIDDETKNEYTFYYKYYPSVPYTVYYLTKDNLGNNWDEVVYDGQTYYQIYAMKYMSNNENVIVTENAELIGGYVFDEYQKRLAVDPNDPSKNVIYFFYEKDTVNGQYVVHYMTETADGSGYEEHSSFTGKMAGGSKYEVPNPPKEIENFTFDESNPSNVLEGTVQTSTVLELWVYYTRNEYSYTVQYLEETTNKVLASEKSEKAKWEAKVTENAITIPNYTELDPTTVTIQISEDEDENLIIFYYREQTVNLYYKVVGPDGMVDDDGVANYGKVDPNSESVKISNGKALGSVASAASDVYKFVGWYDNKSCTGTPISTNATYVPTKEADKLWVDGTTYYAKFEYNLTSLTIKKDGVAGYANIDPNQTFIFNIRGNGIDLDVTVHGSDWDVVVDGLTVGATYTITEKTDWSWRYNCTGWYHDNGGNGTGNIAQITIGLNGTITFTNTRSNEQWLDGDSWCNNIFK